MSVGSISLTIIWPFVSLITFLGTVFVTYASSSTLITSHSIADVSKEYSLMISPSSWTFFIYGVIYTWQFLWMMYILFLCCKYEMRSIIFGPIFYIIFIFSNLLNILLVILWCNKFIIGAGISLIFATVLLYIAVVFSHYFIMIKANGQSGYYDYDDIIPYWLNDNIKTVLLILVLNGVSFYAQWFMFMSCLNLGIILCYSGSGNINDQNSSFISLSILTFFLFIYFCFDFSKKYGRMLKYTFSPYIMLIFIFVSILIKDGINTEKYPPSIMSLILLIITVLMLFIKIYRSIFAKNISNWNDSFLSVEEF